VRDLSLGREEPERLGRAAGLVGAVIRAVVAVRVPLPQLPARRLVLLAAAAVAVVVVGRRRGPLAMLMVVPVAVGGLFGAAVGLAGVPVDERRPSLGVVQVFEVVVAVNVDDVAILHHLQVGPDAVVAGARVVAEVDDVALVGALVRRLDPGEAEFVGDVASYDLHHLGKKIKLNTSLSNFTDFCTSVNNRI